MAQTRTRRSAPAGMGPLRRALRRLATWRPEPDIVEHHLALTDWPLPKLRIAVLSDAHVVPPWVTLADLRRIAGQVRALEPDMVVVAGDLLRDHNVRGPDLPAAQIVAALEPLRAPLGVFAVLGNHDWHECPLAQATGNARNSVVEAFAASPHRLLVNEAAAVQTARGPLWVVGFDTQIARRKDWTSGRHDPAAAFAGVPPGAPALLLAHEPDYFASEDARARVQISGHTHGGQLNLLGWRPMTPSQFGGRYAWGAVREGNRHLVVSGGIGCSGLPLRIGQPPEITLVTLTPAP